ncbi:growth-regulating factor 5-like [Silene latifolia]|uniref:growth-regulating factor 5-like n=1 Tax=Silene latifolia TaxID=37657 RepID=UPI003D7801E2
MIAERNNNRCSNNQQQCQYPFTANQWQELENQVLTFRYLMSGVPVPPGLMSTVITSSSSSSSCSRLFPLQQSLPFGLGCFQVGYGYGRKHDPEPGRCKRTDGKKWRCAKEAHPDSKYCERHMNRGKGKSKKQIDASNNTAIPKPVTNIYPNTATTMKSSSCLPYPTISYSSETQSTTYPNKFQPNTTATTFYPFLPSQSSATVSLSDRDDVTSSSSLWLDQHNAKEIRYSNQIKGRENERMMGSEALEEEKLGTDQEHDSQKFYHHFLGDWPMKSKTSYDMGLFSRSN